MSQHLLHGTKIGASFYQMRSKRMPESMRRDCFFNSCFKNKVFDNQENHYPGQSLSPAVQKQNIFFPFNHRLVHSCGISVNVDEFNSAGTNWYQAFFVSLTNYSYKTYIQVKL